MKETGEEQGDADETKVVPLFEAQSGAQNYTRAPGHCSKSTGNARLFIPN